MSEAILNLILAIIFLLIPSVVSVLLNNYIGILLGGIPTLILFVPFLWLFKEYIKKFFFSIRKIKNLKACQLSGPDNQQLYFEYNNDFYSYSQFLNKQTIARLRQNEKTLINESQKIFNGEVKNIIDEIECFAANAALILKKNNKNYENFATVTTNFIVENRESIVSSPTAKFEELFNRISLP